MLPTGQIQIIVGHRLGSGLMARGKDQLRSRLVRGAAMPDAEHLRREAAGALRLAKELFDALTRQRLQDLAAHYLQQAIELESGGRTAPPDIDPTE
jgi:hypothetical protein